MKDSVVQGGVASSEGVTFFGDSYTVKVRETEDGNFAVTSSKAKRFLSRNSFLQYFFDLPFIRGVFKIWSIFLIMVIDLISTSKLVVLMWIVYLGYSYLRSHDGGVYVFPEWISLSAVIPLIALLIFYRRGLSKYFDLLFSYHGAEHKVAATYRAGLSLDDLSALRSSSRISDYCGTRLLLSILLCSVLLEYLWPNAGEFLLFNMTISLGFELSSDLNSVWARPFVLMSRLVQKYVVTKEPSDQQLLMAAAAIKELLRLEGQK